MRRELKEKEKRMCKTVLFTGLPGSGKGTQADLLAEKTGWRTLSSGKRFRELREGTTAVAESIRDIYDTGKMLPDEIPLYFLMEALFDLPPDAGIVLDGFARNQKQAHEVANVLKLFQRPYCVIELVVSDEVSLTRQLNRLLEENRPDSDTEAKIRLRIKEQKAGLAAATTFFRYQGLLHLVQGNQEREAVFKDIQTLLATK